MIHKNPEDVAELKKLSLRLLTQNQVETTMIQASCGVPIRADLWVTLSGVPLQSINLTLYSLRSSSWELGVKINYEEFGRNKYARFEGEIL